MSRGARWTLGIACLSGALAFFLLAYTSGHLRPNWLWAFHCLGSFWLIVAIACLVPRTIPVTARIIGATVFLVYVWYAFDSAWRDPDRLGKALRGLVWYGLPGLYVTVHGKFPSWGSGAWVSQEDDAAEDDDCEHSPPR